jgi:hypothetical protein
MKKGLLSILAASAVLVGCQNYDDQFDALNTQITKLSSTVDGLAGVQSDVAALKGLITSLQTEVGSVQSTLAADLAVALSAIEEVETLVNDVASSEDLQQVQDDLDGVSTDVTEILESNNVYSTDVIVNSEGTLDFAVALGTKLSIVNGNVVFIVDSTMDIAKVQEALDNIGIVVGEFAYLAKSSTVSPVNFNNITSAEDIEIAQAGSYSFAALTSARDIAFGSNYNSKVTGISMPLLKSVTSFSTGGVSVNAGVPLNGADRVNGPATVNNKISFTKANSIDINTLARYGTALELAVDEGGTIGIAALDDVDATGQQTNITLSIEGPSSISIENLKDGALTFKNVGDVIVNGFEGPFVLEAGVVSFKADKAMQVATASATDLEVFEITGIVDPDNATGTAAHKGPAVVFDSNSNIRIIKLKGVIDDVDLNNNSDLEEAHVTADVSDEINITNNSSLIAVNTTDSKATGVVVSGNSDLETLSIVTTTVDGPDADTKVDGNYEVTNNASLLSVAISSNKVSTLKITGNDDMTSIDLSGMTTLGDTATGQNLSIFANDLTATRGTDSSEGTSNKAPGAAGDEGTFSESAGMKTVKAIATKFQLAADATSYIYFDTVETFDPVGSGAETNDHTFVTAAVVSGIPTKATQPEQTIVLHKEKDNSVALKPAIARKRAFLIKGYGTTGDLFTLNVNNADILASTTPTNMASPNPAVNVGAILSAANLASADAAGVTLTATAYANPSVEIEFGDNTASTEASAAATVAIASDFEFNASDNFTLELAGDNPANISGTAYTTAAAFTAALLTAWNTANSNANITDFTAAASGTTAIVFTAVDEGTSQIGKLLKFTGTIASQTQSNIGFNIYNGYDGYATGALSSDNVARGNAIVVAVEADTAGVALSEIGSTNASGASGVRLLNAGVTAVTAEELYSTLNPYLATIALQNTEVAGTTEYPGQSRSDVVNAADEVGGSVSTSVNFNRVTWLAD